MAKSTVHVPGTVLKDLLDKYNISVAKISDDIGLSPSAIRQIINNKLKISIVIAMKLGKYFGKKPEYWIDLQNTHDLALLQKDSKITGELRKISEAKKQPAPAKAAVKTSRAAAKTGAKAKGKPGRKTAGKAAGKTAGKGKAAGKTTGRAAKAKAPARKAAAEKKPRKPRTPKPKVTVTETSSYSPDSTF